MQRWRLDDIMPHAASASYREFQRSDRMSTGVYVIPAGGRDPQSPHEQDEVYHCVRGRARFVADGEDVEVRAGTVIFVPAHEAHRFVDVEEELVLLVVFAPAESR